MIAMLRRLAHRVSSVPLLYECIQAAAGQSVIHRNVRASFAGCDGAKVLDVGSSGGSLTKRWSSRATALDIDIVALRRAKRKRASLRLVVGDAVNLPFASESFDHVFCIAVSHHLDGDSLLGAVCEMARVARTSIFFLDAVKSGRRLPRVLWSLDRGGYPRTAGEIRAVLESHFDVDREVHFNVFHDYVFWTARPKRV